MESKRQSMPHRFARRLIEVCQVGSGLFFWGSRRTFQFEKLLVDQKSVDFADQLCSPTEQFSRGYDFVASRVRAVGIDSSSNFSQLLA
jgi:hypothetical protein